VLRHNGGHSSAPEEHAPLTVLWSERDAVRLYAKALIDNASIFVETYFIVLLSPRFVGSPYGGEHNYHNMNKELATVLPIMKFVCQVHVYRPDLVLVFHF
jgi:hypothetical protein